MNRYAAALALFATLFAGALCADRISYWKGAGAKRTVDTLDGVTVTGWNAKAVAYKTADNKTGSVDTVAVISLDRKGGSMSKDLETAINLIAEDAGSAADQLGQLAGKGNDLDKEEAMYRRAGIYGTEARASNKANAVAAAINEYNAYVNRYKAGFFAREAYTTLVSFQRRAKKDADARAVLKGMINADPSLQRLGNQKLGELEAAVGDWKAAISAFKSAEGGSGDDKNAKYLAIAWQGFATLKGGDAAAARPLLESVTGDDSFQDDTSLDDEAALAVAYPALGDVYWDGGNYQKAYDNYVMGAYYVWWNAGDNEGYCLGQACACARKLQGTDAKWKDRAEKLKTALAVGFPRELQRIDNMK